ncbi:MAG TPA: TIGR01777 family protein [Campylobacterales bacterium]|nr:TIGR01777 family protein [Campylobacterales bacterium]
MKQIAITGASGFVGTHLTQFFQEHGYTVTPIRRSDLKDTQQLQTKLKQSEIVINLAGANILQRWSEAYKKTLYHSRIDTTRALVQAIESLDKRPSLLISTSAVGIYKNDQEYTEYATEFDEGFLAHICQDWEAEAQRARALGVRTVITRFGVVLGRDGGALQKMLLPFKLGLGGMIGDGKQAFPFIHIDDLARFYLHAIEKEEVQGIYNMTAPQLTTNYGLTKALGSILHRPTILPLPSFVVALIFGEGASVLTDGQTVIPQRTLESGFTFTFESIEEVLEDILM